MSLPPSLFSRMHTSDEQMNIYTAIPSIISHTKSPSDLSYYPACMYTQEAAEWDGIWAQPDQFPVNALRNIAIEEVSNESIL
jgi:hypothetical protein